MTDATNIHASASIGMKVYTTEPDASGHWDVEAVAGMDTSWDNVGEINDLIITRESEMSAVLVDIGSFVGMGERQVAINMDELRFVADSETVEPNDFFLVIPATLAEL